MVVFLCLCRACAGFSWTGAVLVGRKEKETAFFSQSFINTENRTACVCVCELSGGV